MKTNFTAGDKAFVLEMNEGRNKDPRIHEVQVKSIGKKYIHTSRCGYVTKFLADKPHYGLENYDLQLFPTKESAEECMECHAMRHKLRRMDFSQLQYNTLKTILALCNAESIPEEHLFCEGDIVYVSNPDQEYEAEYGERVHRNFFGKVIMTELDCITVDWGNDEEWSYLPEELSHAKGLQYMTLQDFSNTFGLSVNGTFI